MRQPGMLATRLAAFALIVSSGCGGSGPGPAADAQVEIPGSDAAADTPEPPDAPPGDETPADPTCQPDCTGKDCGDDGCGGDCGACTGDTVCKSGRCRPTTCVEPDECPPGYQLHDGCRCRVPPTGVWQCRNDKGLVDCSTIAPGDDYYGQDGHFPAGVLAATDLGDGTARDDLTGLVWAKEASGPFPWQDGLAFPAREQCEQNKAGLPGAGWKLPGVLPLMFIVDYSNTKSPMWHPVFGHEYPSPLFWTATHLPRADGLVFLVGFGGGAVE
ncbi:MAG: DUF1566 domain-containing protein, partial [Deltaproteobacteria bacterium]|nr:DUF1566 domain-containing protein [Deltaproteobacteria bacterium]